MRSPRPPADKPHQKAKRRMTATAEKETSKETTGRVVRVTGPVVDVEFPRGSVPDLFNALHADTTFGDLAKPPTLEVAQHHGDNTGRRRDERRGAEAREAVR